eukprot:3842657-Rhodomonas_salina.1
MNSRSDFLLSLGSKSFWQCLSAELARSCSCKVNAFKERAEQDTTVDEDVGIRAWCENSLFEE